MTRFIPTAGLAALTVLATACAPTSDTALPGENAAARPERQCFGAEQVRNFRAGDTGQLFIRVMRDDVYELNTSGGCTDLDFAQRIEINPDVGGLVGGRICTGDWARITLPHSSARIQSCRARVSRVLTAEEVAALPGARRP